MVSRFIDKLVKPIIDCVFEEYLSIQLIISSNYVKSDFGGLKIDV
jgi:hypothetical protein